MFQAYIVTMRCGDTNVVFCHLLTGLGGVYKHVLVSSMLLLYWQHVFAVMFYCYARVVVFMLFCI